MQLSLRVNELPICICLGINFFLLTIRTENGTKISRGTIGFDPSAIAIDSVTPNSLAIAANKRIELLTPQWM